MNKSNLLKGALVSGLIFLASCSPSLDTTRVPMGSAPHPSNSSTVTQLNSLVDSYRQSIGKPAIPRNAGLDQLARQHCEFMARNRGKFNLGSKNISHYGFEERIFIARRQLNMANLAENIAGGFIRGDIPQHLVDAWSESKNHAYNLEQDWDATGLGLYTADDGMVYATQIFATKSMSRRRVSGQFSEF